jgi:glutamyl-Q tRNA(Asp) synthetase
MTGAKLSKQTRAAPVDAAAPVAVLFAALRFLGQNPPAELRRAASADFWHWAHAHWRLDRVPRTLAQPVADYHEEKTA